MTFRHRYSTPSTQPVFSSSDSAVCDIGIEGAIEDIRVEWEQQGKGSLPGYAEIIDIALRRMRLDLDSGGVEVVGEVIEDLRREIGYRQWCARALPV